jgi:hypothetical protein
VAANFVKDLKRGRAAEEEFILIHPAGLTKSEDKGWDFNAPNGDRIELKTDFYDPGETDNLFIERLRNLGNETPGGIWQAAAAGATVFIYWFPEGKFYLECRDIPKLICRLESIIEGLKPFDVYNRTYKTRGYRVPRKLLKDCFDIYFHN